MGRCLDMKQLDRHEGHRRGQFEAWCGGISVIERKRHWQGKIRFGQGSWDLGEIGSH